MPYTAASIPQLADKRFVITGGNSGLGLETARLLLGHGAKITIACRDEAKMAQAATSLAAELPGSAPVDQVVLDLASLASVRSAAATLAKMHPRIDGLINNAGIMAIPERKTADGIEMQFGTNHLGHFALTGLLLPQVVAAKGRVVTVSSVMHMYGHLVLSDIPVPKSYSPRHVYSMSKLANVLFAYELDRRLKAARLPVLSVACHPGYSATNLQLAGPRMSGSKLQTWLMKGANAVFAQSSKIGALAETMAATDPALHGGEYIGGTDLMGFRGYPVVAKSSAESHDQALAKELWTRSEALSFVTFDFNPATSAVAAAQI